MPIGTIMLNYKTTDIVLAACLKLEAHYLECIEVEGRRGTFVFKNVSADFLNEFNCGQVRVDPVAFHGMLRQLSTSVNRQIEISKK